MIDGVTGDPGSCSQLGGALRSHAARLLSLREDLVSRSSRVLRPGGQTSDAELAGDLDAQLRLLDTIINRLDDGGAALQRYAQELAELAEAIRRLEAEATAEGLVLEGLRVVEPWGVLTTELAQQRHRAAPALQQRADRLASQLGRARGATTRAMVQATQTLAAAAAVARTRSGT